MRSRTSFIVLLIGTALTILPAAAQEVGTTTAVNPLSESTPPGASTQTLTVGSHIVHKERIHTTPTGTVQLLFVDKSSMSIAPNTTITIDEYVYNPDANAGHMLVSLTEGALRFVGGKLSHQGEAELSTPAAVIGIRGGSGTFIFNKNGVQVIDHYGVMKIHNGAGTFTINRAGFTVTVADWNTPPSPFVRVSGEQTTFNLNLLTSKPGQDGGVSGLKTVGIGDCGIGALPGTSCPAPPWNPTYGGQNDASGIITQATQLGTARQQFRYRGN
jgi:hypothetical protein